MALSRQQQKYVSLSIGVLAYIIGGIVLGFNVYAIAMKQTFNYTQTELDNIASSGDLGLPLTFPAGIVVDMFGPRIASSVSLILTTTGFALTWMATEYRIFFSSHSWLLCVFYFLASVGTRFIIIATKVICCKSFNRRHIGKIVGLFGALFGVSPAGFSVIYNAFFVQGHIEDPKNQKFGEFMLMLAVLSAAINAYGVVMLRVAPEETIEDLEMKEVTDLSPHENKEKQCENNDCESKSSKKSGVIPKVKDEKMSRKSAPYQNATNKKVSEKTALIPKEAEDKVSEKTTLYQSDKKVSEKTALYQKEVERKVNENTELIQNKKSRPVIPEMNWWQMLKTTQFYYIFTICILIAGNGGTITNNITIVVKSASIDPNLVPLTVIIPICASAGQFIGGALPDTISEKWPNLPKASFLLMPGVLSLISQITFIFFNTNVIGLTCSSLMLSFAYGALYPPVNLLVVEYYGLNHFGQNFGLVAVSHGIGIVFFQKLFAWNYENFSPIGVTDCYGELCTRWYFVLLAILCSLVIVLIIGLIKIERDQKFENESESDDS